MAVCREGFVHTKDAKKLRESGYSLPAALRLSRLGTCVPLPCKWFFPDPVYSTQLGHRYVRSGAPNNHARSSNVGYYNKKNVHLAHHGCSCDYVGGWTATVDGTGCVPLFVDAAGALVHKLLPTQSQNLLIWDADKEPKPNVIDRNQTGRPKATDMQRSGEESPTLRNDKLHRQLGLARNAYHRAVYKPFGPHPQTIHRYTPSAAAPLALHIEQAMSERKTHRETQHMHSGTLQKHGLTQQGQRDAMVVERGSFSFSDYWTPGSKLRRSVGEAVPFYTAHSVPACIAAKDTDPMCEEVNKFKHKWVKLNPKFALKNTSGGVWWTVNLHAAKAANNIYNVAKATATKNAAGNKSTTDAQVDAALLHIGAGLPDEQFVISPS